jgi:hypothetical protein
MKQNSISDLNRLYSENMENIFNVYTDDMGMYYYNLLQTISFPTDLPPNLFKPYTISYGDTWPFISFKTLNHPNLWWIILLANNIQNPITSLVVGTTIRIPLPVVVREVVAQINR